MTGHAGEPDDDRLAEELGDELAKIRDVPEEHDDPRLRIPETLSGPRANVSSRDATETRDSSAVEMGRAWGIALDFVFTILAGGGLGWLFDRWRHTTPTGALIGLSAGFVLAFIRIVRATARQERLEAEQRRAREKNTNA